MKKILNIKIPIIKSYKWHAVPLTVLSSGVGNEAWMNIQNINLSLIDKYVDLKSFFIDCINCGYYIDQLYDLFYIEYSFTYGNTHRTSKLLGRV